MSEGLILAVFGIALGVTAALALGGQITALLYGVDERDWITLVTVAGVLILASVGACLVPARAAARLGPQEALRGD